MLNIALPKGRLGEKVYELFARAGYECPAILENSRKLIFENEEKGVRYFWVKPSDVAIYVERGAADIGVAGKDILLEYAPDVYELLDFRLSGPDAPGYGQCVVDESVIVRLHAQLEVQCLCRQGHHLEIIRGSDLAGEHSPFSHPSPPCRI